MLFSSPTFICLFLPIVTIGYYAFFRWNRFLSNLFLFGVSIVFYAWGEPRFVFVMLGSIIMNWVFGILVSIARKRCGGGGISRVLVFLSVICNLSVLFVYKYLNFTASLLRINSFSSIVLPIGISFFTFQAMSYVIDVYRGNGAVQYNLLNVGLYISFFPQLIAGPIVRYKTVAEQIRNRVESFDDFCNGFFRFAVGFCKKVLLANNFAIVADIAFQICKDGKLTVAMGWLGAICYTLQIFFDFSGYSDMAIGLGEMFGFHFLENFDYPYISTSITEFWRRWHISLGSWFRDYVYIPLGGNRCQKQRQVFNLFVVWTLTGIWHGANWTFLLWGLMYFVLLTLEKMTPLGKALQRAPRIISWMYVMLFIVLGWVIFRADSILDAIRYVSSMFGIGVSGVSDAIFLRYIKQTSVYLIAGCVFSTPIMKTVKLKGKYAYVCEMIGTAALALLFVAAFASIVSNKYNPFIYFNF